VLKGDAPVPAGGATDGKVAAHEALLRWQRDAA
jgi:hypothetical protein